ncbi:protein kinase domain-containing protein [Sorangium sp. So ce1335]|uniref:protein kinase domain-containing protein n=1 Tax=Sorangium sp. So ce1335 TaxID=3133335 RepID=UPI003F6465E6
MDEILGGMTPGERLGARYIIERQAGKGGLGTVYRARDGESGAPVAIKVIREPTADKRSRFAREARALAALSHPCIVRYIAHGQTPDGELYLVMEWLEGEDLGARLARGRLGPAAALKVVTRVAEGLASAHARGIVHRDIKPQNIFLRDGELERATIVDLGLARLADATASLTRTGATVGTPSYMAPEQVIGEGEVDARADIYALGCVLFACLAGRPPFTAAHPLAMLARVVFEEPPRLSALAPGVPAELDAFVARLLAKQAGDRPDARAVIEELRALAARVAGSSSIAPASAAGLTRRERRLVSVILALAPEPAAPAMTAGSLAATAAHVDAPLIGALYRTSQTLRQVAARHGAQLELLRDGSLAAVITGAGSPTDLALNAARCAMALRDLLPGAHVALSTGWDELEKTQPMGQVIDRASALLAGTAAARAADRAPPDPRAAATLCDPKAAATLDPKAAATLAPEAAAALDPEAAAALSGREAERTLSPRTLSAREAARPAGGADSAARVLLDRMTADLLGDRFEVSLDRSTLALIGELEPADEARKLLGRPTRCAGRERELLLLQSTFDECVAESEARAVLVTADAGVGKSRLRHELARRLAARGAAIELWIARGDPMRMGAPCGMLAQIVRRAAGLLDGEPLEARQQKLAARVAERVAAPLRRQVTEFLGEMVGAPFPAEASVLLRTARQDAKVMGDQMQAAWVELVRAECRTRPVLLVLEDLHWGDRPTVEYVDAALRLLEGERLMVLALARPEVREAFPDLWSKRALTDLRLVGLSRRTCEKLVVEALGAPDPETVARIVDRAGGNAFFLEELVRAAAEGHGGGVPETVLAMMQSRLEGLAPDARRVLRAGSVFGGVFWRGAAGALLGAEAGEAHLDEQLGELAQSELIVRLHASTFQGEVAYAFRHALVRDAAYEMLTEEDRQLGHRLAGAWLARAGETDAMVLATHFERGGDLERALGHYRQAAGQALGGCDCRGAIERAERAIACGASGEALGELEAIKAQGRRILGESAAAERHALAAMRALPEGSPWWCRAACVAVWACAVVGHRETVVELARALCARWSPSTTTGPELAAMAQAAQVLHYAVGESEESEALASRIDASFDRFRNDPAVSAPILRLRMHRAALAGDLGGARELGEASERCYIAAGDARGACDARVNAAHHCNELGAYADAARLLRAALADAERLGLPYLTAFAKENLGRTLFLLGDLGEARAQLDAALRVFAASGDRRMEGGTYVYLAEVSRLAGDLARAEEEARRGCELLADCAPLMPCALATLAQVLLTGGRPAEALEAARRADEHAAALVRSLGHLEEGEAQLDLVRAEALEACGAREEACAAIEAGRGRLLKRAARIANPAWRASFLENVREHARILALARAWLGEPDGAANAPAGGAP